MLTRLREIVEKVASAPRLNEALDIPGHRYLPAMETEVCSVYLADHDRRCYYLMATRGLKNRAGAPLRSRLMKVWAWLGAWPNPSTLPTRKTPQL
jgi:phosphotransferase system enzyme I (PtsP)